MYCKISKNYRVPAGLVICLTQLKLVENKIFKLPYI